MFRTTRAALAVTVAMAALGVAGCGSDDDEATTAATGGTAATETSSAAPSGPKGDPIVIGNIGSYTGPLANATSKGPDVLQAWAKATNAAGGLNGHPVKVVSVDDGQNPAKALAGAKKLVEEDGAIAIVGELTGQPEAFAKYLTSKNVPVVGGQSIAAPYLTDPNFFPSGSTLVPMLFGAVQLAKSAGSKTLGVTYCSETPLCAQAVPVLQGLTKASAMKIETQKVASTAPNYTAPCLALEGKNAESLITVVTASIGPRIVQSCASQGYKPVAIGTSSSTDESWLENDAVDGALISSAQALYTDKAVPGVKRFYDAIDEYAPGLVDSPQFSTVMLYPWSGGELFAAAAKAGKLTPESTGADVKKALYQLKDETLGGIAPPLNFVEGKPSSSPCWFTSKIEGGKFVATNGNKPVCLEGEQAAALAGALG